MDITLFSVCVAFLATGSLVYGLEGPNVCTKEEEYPVEVKVETTEPYEVKTYHYCMRIPPRCVKRETKMRKAWKTETKVKKRVVDICCNGYAETGGRCIPLCSNSCIHGRCIEPEKCECTAGWGGDNCNISCEKGKYGPKCQQLCSCKNGANCNPVNGECSCSPGWIGKDCGSPCHEKYFGFLCLQECKCQNGAKCDHISGSCKCIPGYKGTLCSELCQGDDCINGCYCKNNGNCNADNTCTCPPGWEGDDCSIPCRFGSYGYNCSHTCNCVNSLSCDAVSGNCVCAPGFIGSTCSEKCPPGQYGENCSKRCSCPSINFECDHARGCVCKYGVNENNCDLALNANSIEIKSEPKEMSSSKVGLIATLCCLFIIVLILSGFLILKYKKKLHQLKTELAYVTYVRDGADADQFENPVYAYQPPSSSGASGVKLVKNNLNTKGLTEKSKLNMSADENGENGACGGIVESSAESCIAKDFNYSSNIYNSIEDFKCTSDRKEPFYDEIKPKTGEETYDHPRGSSVVNSPPPSYDSLPPRYDSIQFQKNDDYDDKNL